MNAINGQCRYLTSLAVPILDGLDDSHLAIEPMPGVKTAGWLIGHLATSGDYARRLCGRAPLCPKEWQAKFNPGTQPSTDAGDYPSMAAMIECFFAVYRDLSEIKLEELSEVLAAPTAFAPARPDFPTSADFVAYLMTSHLSYHLGQLVAWRAAAGVGRVKRPASLVA